jgi:hypothetical protein
MSMLAQRASKPIPPPRAEGKSSYGVEEKCISLARDKCFENVGRDRMQMDVSKAVDRQSYPMCIDAYSIAGRQACQAPLDKADERRAMLADYDPRSPAAAPERTVAVFPTQHRICRARLALGSGCAMEAPGSR